MKRQLLLAGSCAQHALQAAFETLGKHFSLARLHWATRSLSGTDVPNLEKGIQRLGYNTWAYEYNDARKTEQALLNQLALGNPCIVAVNDSNHWIAVLGVMKEEPEHFVCFDSSNKYNLLRCWTWTALRQWMISNIANDDYFFIAIRNKGDSVVQRMHKLYPILHKNPQTWFNYISTWRIQEKEK
jgi:hypothetical protein